MTKGRSDPGNMPYVPLARACRPQKFSDVIGQETTVKILQRGIIQERLGTALLFTGIRGTGKTTLARLVAKALNCQALVDLPSDFSGAIEACGVCPSCVALQEHRHFDILEIDAASHTGVDDVREMTETARYQPTLGRRRVFILDEAHMLSKSAFNALLKVLEEPPLSVMFILATTEAHKIPATILSRCLRFDLRRVDDAEILGLLKILCEREGCEADDEALKLLARVGEGSVRDTLSLLERALLYTHNNIQDQKKLSIDLVQEILGLADQGQVLELGTDLFRGDIASALERIHAFWDAGKDPLLLLEQLGRIIHIVSYVQTAKPDARGLSYLSKEERTFADLWVSKLSVPYLGRFWQMILKGMEEVKSATFPRQAFEMLAIRITHVHDLMTPEAFMRADQHPPASANMSLEEKKKPAHRRPSLGPSESLLSL